MKDSLLELYKQLVYWVSSHAPIGWELFQINMEMAKDEYEIANSWVMKCYDKNGNKLEIDISGRYKAEMRDLFIEIYEKCYSQSDKWSACDFKVTSTGKYEVNYSYGKPPRLSGDLLSGA